MSFTIDSLLKLNRFLALHDDDRSVKIRVALYAREWLHTLDINRFEKLGFALGACTSLQVLDLKWNDLAALSAERFYYFTMALAQCKTLQHIDLSFNNIGNMEIDNRVAHIQKFCSALGQCKALRSIDLSGNALGKLEKEEFEMLIKSLSKCKMLLDIQGIESNKFSPDQKTILKDVLNHHCNKVFQPLRMSLSTMSADSEEERSDHEKPRRRRLKRN